MGHLRISRFVTITMHVIDALVKSSKILVISFHFHHRKNFFGGGIFIKNISEKNKYILSVNKSDNEHSKSRKINHWEGEGSVILIGECSVLEGWIYSVLQIRLGAHWARLPETVIFFFLFHPYFTSQPYVTQFLWIKLKDHFGLLSLG